MDFLFIQQLEIVYKLESSICTTLGNKLTLLDIANAKAVNRIPQISQPFLSAKILYNSAATVCVRASSSFHVSKILIYALPNADYEKIEVEAPQTKHNKYYFYAKKAII